MRRLAVLAAALIALSGCLGFGDDTVELTFVDHIEAGMIEQDVFVERTPGSNKVFRVGKSEAARYADAPVYRTTMPVRHAPYSPKRNGPYPKGASLGLSLGDWLRATGKVAYACAGGEGRIEAAFRDLVPNGTYTMWYLRAAKPHIDCADCPYATLDLPIGARDGSQSMFVADARGFAVYDATFKPCLKPSDDQLSAALAIAYHSDGNTHGPSPGAPGSRSHLQLLAVLPGANEK